jgi:hypothetical protein
MDWFLMDYASIKLFSSPLFATASLSDCLIRQIELGTGFLTVKCSISLNNITDNAFSGKQLLYLISP